MLVTPRVHLRQMCAADASGYAELLNDSTAYPYLSETPIPPHEIPSRIARNQQYFETRQHLYWTIASIGSSQFVGYVAAHNLCAKNVALSYGVLSDFRRRGIATEALEAVIFYLFNVLGVSQVEASVHPRNVASKELLHRLGFKEACQTGTEPASTRIRLIRQKS